MVVTADIAPPKGYKQTEVGVIPEDWEEVELSEIATADSPICYGIVQVGQYTRNGVPVLAIKNLNTDYATEVHQASADVERPYTRSRIEPADVLISVKGTTGRIGLVPPGFYGNISRDLARLRPRKNLDPRFCYQMLQSGPIQRRLNSATVGTTRMELSINVLKQVGIPLPPTKAEQEAIAEALSDADALIESLDQLIAKKRRIKQGAMQELLTGKKRLQGFSGEWEVKRLGDLGFFFKGNGVKRDEARSGPIPCIRYGEIYTHYNDVITEFNSYISREVASSAVRLKAGDILFAGSGETKEEIGKCVAFVDEIEAYAGGDIVILRPEGVDSTFLGYYLNTGQIARQKSSKGQGDAVVHISSAALSGMSIKVPTQAEQTAIATILSDMDAEIAALETKLDKARQVKQGMMHNLLTGRIRLV